MTCLVTGDWASDVRMKVIVRRSHCHVAMVAKFLDLNNMSCKYGSCVDQCTCFFLH